MHYILFSQQENEVIDSKHTYRTMTIYDSVNSENIQYVTKISENPNP